MSDVEASGVQMRRRRRWRFADCIFDEASWSLNVDGQRVSSETKPLQILRVLLDRAGDLVSKTELLDLIWPDVTVVEASLPTAIHKLRLALNDARRDPPIIETVSRIGYRIAVPVNVEEPGQPADQSLCAPLADLSGPPVLPAVVAHRTSWRSPLRLLSMLAGIVLVGSIGTLASNPLGRLQATKASPPYTQQQARDAIRKLDFRAVERMIAAGWDPNLTFDDQGNAAIEYALERCEWGHGRNGEQILLMVRTLTEAGAVVDRRNVWGDTPYSIAKAPRFCGPAHPVTRYLQMMCAQGKEPLGDRCMASYELARGHHFSKNAALEVASR